MSILTRLTHRTTGTIAHLTISRPTKLNALNTPLLLELPATIHSLTTTNKDLLAIILTGAGPKSFIGGADIAEMARLDSATSARTFISRVSRACRSIRECEVPVIGRVNGYALGAGLEVAISCDFRVVSSKAVFGMPEVGVILFALLVYLRDMRDGRERIIADKWFNRFGLESPASLKRLFSLD
jgi:enoyl-CoA hydratase/carnithine racemase